MRRSLVGRRFGRLKVKHFAGADKWRKTYWCCTCECGASLRVRGEKLLSGRQVSCGCARADKHVRREARLKVPSRKRKQIARMGASASRDAERVPPFSLDAHRAAEILGVSLERIELLARDKTLGSRYVRGALFVSAEQISAMAAEQARESRRCQHLSGGPPDAELDARALTDWRPEWGARVQ